RSCLSLFIFSLAGPHRPLPSFPTRRSSDLTGASLRAAPSLPDGGRAGRRGQPAAPPGPRGGGLRDRALGRRVRRAGGGRPYCGGDRKSTRLNSSHVEISYAVFCLKKKKKNR